MDKLDALHTDDEKKETVKKIIKILDGRPMLEASDILILANQALGMCAVVKLDSEQ